MLLPVPGGQVHGSAGRFVDAGDAVEEGCFSGSVGAYEGDDFLFVNRQIKFVQGPQAAEVLREARDFEDRFHALSSLL